MIDANDDDVIVVWVGDHPMIARSNDRGESFEVSTLQADHIADIPVTHLQNGVVHAVWRIIDTSAFDIYYSRSEPALGEMTEPMLIDTLALDTGAYPPTVTSDGADRVVIAWFETCGYEGPCSTEGPGVYTRTSTDGGATFEPAVRITQWRTSPSAGPLLGWVDGGVVAAWNEAPFEPIGITLADGEAGYAAFAQFDLAFGASIGRSSDDIATLFWHEGVTGGGGGGVAKLARLRGRSADAIDPERTIAESILGTDFWVTMDAHDDVVVAIASEGVVFRSATRRLIASLDGGESMLAPQALDFLLDDNTDVTPSDTFSIPIAIADDERAHIAWMRTSDVYVHEVMYAHGDRIAPCGVKPYG